MPYKDKAKQKAAQRASYERNKERYLETNKRTNRSLHQLIIELKTTSPCFDCGVFYPHYVMQYDHVGTDKIAGVSALVRSASRARVLAEIDKCELVCANCHAERTWQRLSH